MDFLVTKDKIFSNPCTYSLVVSIYGPCGVDNCIMVIIEAMNEDCEQQKLFYPIPNVKYCISTMGLKVFWPCKYVLMNDEKVATTRD